MRILIGTPTHDGVVTTAYMSSVLALLRAVPPGIQLDLKFISGSDVVMARNAFASLVLQDENLTHLLFIDSDLGFRAEAILRLIQSGKDFVGCFYPRRKLDLPRFQRTSRLLQDPAQALSASLEYPAVIRADAPQTGFVQTRLIGAGLLLLHRRVLEQVVARYPELVSRAPDNAYQGLGVRDKIYQAFERYRRPDGIYASEDVSFCLRWVDGCGGEIWGCTDEMVSHIGPYSFSGKLQDRIALEDALARPGRSA